MISESGLGGTIRFERAHAEANQAEGRKTNRYRTEKDATAKGDWHDIAADTPSSPASIRQTERVEDANWGSVAASVADDIKINYSQKGCGYGTPKMRHWLVAVGHGPLVFGLWSLTLGLIAAIAKMVRGG